MFAQYKGRIHGAIVVEIVAAIIAATITATIAPTGCDDDRPVYTPYKLRQQYLGDHSVRCVSMSYLIV